MVLASFFYGYMTTQLIGGVLSPIVGAGRLFGYSCFLSAMLNIITPMMAYYGRLPLIIVRFLLGVVQVGRSLTGCDWICADLWSGFFF